MRSLLSSFICVLTLLCASQAMAASAVYTVELYVDVTSANASQAREKALTEANRKALETVAAKITTAEGLTKIMSLEDSQLANFIKEVSVTSEKSSDIRYIANLQIVINDALLKAYMAEQEIPYMMETSRNVLVIPLFREFKTDRPMLWESGNLWRQAWEASSSGNSPIRIFSIPANGANYAAIDAEKAAVLDGMALNTVARNNQAPDIYVLDATYDGIDGLLIQISSYVGGTNAVETMKVPGMRGPDLFADAVRAVRAKIAGDIKGRDIQESRTQSDMVVMYNYNNIREWINLEKAIKELPYVKRLNLEAIGGGKVQFKVIYIGARTRLIGALNNMGFSLQDHGDIAVLNHR